MTTFVTRKRICSAVKLNVLLEGGGEACVCGHTTHVCQYTGHSCGYTP